MHTYGDCSQCGGQVSPEKVELDYRYKERLYIFQDVPAGVCQQCGEKYLTAEVSKEIEGKILKKEEAEKTVTVPVYIFPEKRAV